MDLICIVGPTGVGKTKLSIELAKKLNGEIINADSTQVYKELNIATAKVTEEEKEGIKHHLFDIKDIKDDYTVYDYQQDCRLKIKELMDNNKLPILVGGTGLYIKAALYDYQFDNEDMKRDYSKYSNEELYQLLKQVDNDTEIHPNNRKRVERALDYYYNNKKPMSEKVTTDKLLYNVLFIGLTTNRDTLYKRINMRVDKMVKEGLLEEAKKIYDSNIRTKAVMTPIGYKELFPYFNTEKSLEECLELIKQTSRRYAKRQLGWFRRYNEIIWLDGNEAINKNINRILEEIKLKKSNIER